MTRQEALERIEALVRKVRDGSERRDILAQLGRIRAELENDGPPLQQCVLSVPGRGEYEAWLPSIPRVGENVLLRIPEEGDDRSTAYHVHGVVRSLVGGHPSRGITQGHVTIGLLDRDSF
ncbi:MAG TPA: hypothetical protein VF192_01480 [Longimicrobiales bacterium]